ncbi:MAG: NYN domain-containing protein [Verrucomicrobiota bacterium]|nr:NYN domain-containing protein [Verrucomicrobiota bacterium]
MAKRGQTRSVLRMGIVRVLVDGYSLLHHWPELAPGRARHSFHARDALVAALTQYQDSSGTPVTLIFDGGGAPPDTPKNETAKDGIEVLFSKKGQTADQIIERVAHLMKPYGEVLAVTNDYAERETVISLGGSACSCENFLDMLNDTVDDMHVGVTQHNKRERKGYRRTD